MTDRLEEAANMAGTLSGSKLAWFRLALSFAESFSTLGTAASSAANTFAAVNGRPSAPRSPRRP